MMTELYAVLLITILAVISPGADFAVVTKNSYLYGRTKGIFTALGISLGVLVHVTYTLIAIHFVMAYTPHILTVIKYLGVFYLFYIGYKTITQPVVLAQFSDTAVSSLSLCKYGFFTNALNPKTTLFVISTYTQIISPATSQFVLVGYGCFMSFAHFVWFGLVALFFSSNQLRNKMLNQQKVINQWIGSILILLGILLSFAYFEVG